MSVNQYHILRHDPHVEAWQLTQEQEQLCQKLLASGRLRIDAGSTSNFTKLTIPEANQTIHISNREITDPILYEITKADLRGLFSSSYHGQALQQKVNSTVSMIKKLLKKNIPIPYHVELKLARMLIQCAHPVIFKMIIHERVEILLTYDYEIGGMMDVQTWQIAGRNSGMQSTDGIMAQIFVAGGGNPFGRAKPGMTFGDGFPAMARMMVIAAQELGHYSDIKRDSYGRQAGRYSANFSGTRANPLYAQARNKDIQAVKAIHQQLKTAGIDQLAEHERVLKYYRKFNKPWLERLWKWGKYRRSRRRVMSNLISQNLDFVFLIESVEFIGNRLLTMVHDMAFNLAPIADVYQNDDPQIEEAIACIEALARVPQQVKKWGLSATKAFMPNLYDLYYSNVIPGCINAYEVMTGRKFKFTATRARFYYFKFCLHSVTNIYKSWRLRRERKNAADQDVEP
ncbi:MAG: DUF2748 family protein [Pseudomonadota bacterium]